MLEIFNHQMAQVFVDLGLFDGTVSRLESELNYNDKNRNRIPYFVPIIKDKIGTRGFEDHQDAIEYLLEKRKTHKIIFVDLRTSILPKDDFEFIFYHKMTLMELPREEGEVVPEPKKFYGGRR